MSLLLVRVQPPFAEGVESLTGAVKSDRTQVYGKPFHLDNGMLREGLRDTRRRMKYLLLRILRVQMHNI